MRLNSKAFSLIMVLTLLTSGSVKSAFAASTGTSPPVAATSANLSNAHLTFDDEFSGGTLNTAVWSPFFPANQTFGSQTFLPDEYQMLAGGGLQLRADKRVYKNKIQGGGAVTTFGAFNQTYGYFEMKAKMPKGNGMWPAFWLLPIDQSWPPEIDILEWLGSQPTVDWVTLHMPNVAQVASTCKGPDLTLDYHTYGLIWRPDQLTWTIDGVKCYSITTNIPSKPMYVTLNLALGGWDKPVDATTPFPSVFDVAYVRAYQFADMAPEVLPDYQFGKTFVKNKAGQVLAAGATVSPGDVLTISATMITGNNPITGMSAGVSIFDYLGNTAFANAYYSSPAAIPANSSKSFDMTVTLPATMTPGIYNVALNLSGSGDSKWQWSAQQVYIDAGCKTANGLSANTCLTALTPIADPTAPQTPPPVTAPVTVPIVSPVTPVAGPDTLVLNVAEDAYLGDAQFTVAVDGKLVGGTQTATALHKNGQSQNVNLTGNFGAGPHTVAVNFINDAYGSAAGQDRNLYVNTITLDGQQNVVNNTQYSGGAVNYAIKAATQDTLILNVAEDAYKGDAMFSVSVDGKPLGTTQTVTALYKAGASQDITLTGAIGSGTHTVAVTFLNDLYGHGPRTDRNLYVNALTANGKKTQVNSALMANGTKTYSLTF